MKKVVVGIIPRININNEIEYLLISSTTDFGKFTGFYYPPGGHIEKGEDQPTALIREIKEELGLNVTPFSKIYESEGDVSDQVTYWWICDAVVENLHLQKDEISDVKWFTKKELIKKSDVWPATKEFFEQLKLGRAVSAGGVVVKKLNGISKILFVKFQNGGLTLPKGHLEPGETYEVAALREVEEESGLSGLTILKKLGVVNRPSVERDGSVVMKEIHYYYLHTDNYAQIRGDEETDWYTLEEAIPNLMPQEVKFFADHKDDIYSL